MTMTTKDGEFVYVDENGDEWVRYDYFKTISKNALENKLIIENILKLLDVHTVTSALAKIVELMNKS